MKKILLIFTVGIILFSNLSAQNLDSLKLTKKEIPQEYSVNKSLKCINNETCTFYEKTELYTMLLGELKHKDIQTFSSKNDSGSIMYFEFKNTFKGSDFLNTMLWGQIKKPTPKHPEQYAVKNNILIIWNFNTGSKIEAISQRKIKAMLKL